MNVDSRPMKEKRKASAFQITLIDADQTIKSLWLPQKAEGKFRFSGNEPDAWYDFFYIVGREEKWYAVCTANACFKTDSGEPERCIPLLNGQFLTIWHDDQEYTLYSERADAENSTYHNYRIHGAAQITIGRTDENDIQYALNCVSRRHATLCWNKNRWVITDEHSLNGTFVNGQRIHQVPVFPGDVIYIAGLRIIMGFDFVSMNDRGRPVSLNPGALRPVRSIEHRETKQMPAEEREQYFTPSPRKRLSMAFPTISVEPPPMSAQNGNMPLLLQMGSSAVMGGSALLAGQFTMLLSSFLFPLLTNRFTDKERKEYEERRVKSYTQYLAEKELEIEKERKREQNVFNRNYPELNTLLDQANREEQLWEHKKTDDDFLCLRIGSGQLPLQAEISYPKRRFNIKEDHLEMQMYNLVEKPIILEDVPILASFTEEKINGVAGDRRHMVAFIRNVLLQLIVTHSYDDVKVVFLADACDVEELEFVKYIPHIWNDQRTFRFLACDVTEAYSISEYLKRELENDLDSPRALKEILKQHPYYVIFALDKKIFDSMEILKRVLHLEENIGVSILAAFDGFPKECERIFQLNKNGTHTVAYLKQLERNDDYFWLEKCDEIKREQCVKRIENTRLKIGEQGFALPKMVSFLDLFGVGRIEHLNIRDRWQRNNPVKSLSTPVGIGTDGSVFNLDLHEKYQGPHGLVAGMTGSGKSEFIITYILSLAVNYHPYEVAFILIDYKGGGLVGAFEDAEAGIRLPHLIGTITNLDGSAIQRSLMSIQSELIRRQRVFNETKNRLGGETIDIYAYQKLFRAGKVAEPMPHLFIISDEFAELKQQQPDFMEQLISAARIGRSLGIHLILATQKPSGVVNDQIRSNAKFKVCLKVQDKSDSMDMLLRPEAAELKDVGRFYLQVGYNEYFALAQSAWCGAQYEPQDTVEDRVENSIAVLDNLGQTVLRIAPEAKRSDSGKKQVTAVVQQLCQLAQEEKIPMRSLWKDPLPNRLDVSEQGQMPKTPVQAYLGRLDDPSRQKQFPLFFDFEHCQNLMIVGEGGSGKTTMVQSILYSLCKNYSSGEVQFYILDYSSRMLKVFDVMPHCGAVLIEENEDSLNDFFTLLNGIVARRKKLFSQWETDSFEAAHAEHQLPLILVVIDGFAGLNATKTGEAHGYKLQKYIRDGVNYGIKYIITCSHLNEISVRIKQELGGRLCLHMREKFDYGEALNCKVSYVPPDQPGRGLYKWEEAPLEFHAAMYCPNLEDAERNKHLKAELEGLREQSGEAQAAIRLPVHKQDADYREFAAQFKPGRIPLGYFKQNPVALPLKQFSALSVYLGNPQGTVPIMSNFLYAAQRERMEILAVCRCESSIFTGGAEGAGEAAARKDVTLYAPNEEQGTLLLDEIMKHMNVRKKLLTDFCQANDLDEKNKDELARAAEYVRSHTTPILVFIENLADMVSNLDMMSEMLLDGVFKGMWQYNMRVIAFFEPKDEKRCQESVLYNGYALNGHMLLFGGRFDKQKFCAVPMDGEKAKELLQYNLAVMRYNDDCYPLLMPCGEIRVEEIPEDDRSIFS